MHRPPGIARAGVAREGRRPLLRSGTILLLLFGLGCGSDEAPPDVDADAAQDRRAEIERLPDWSLAESPDLEIGALDGDPIEQLGDVRAGVFGPHGIYLLDGDSREVRIFDHGGRHVMSLGREGDGPGDFRAPTGLMVGADSTIAVWDRTTRRLTVFGHDGRLLRTTAVRESSLVSPGSLRSVLPDGSFILSDSPPRLDGARTRTQPVIRFSADGELLDTLDMLIGHHVSERRDGYGRPFTSPDLIASAKDGVWVLRVDSARIVRLGPAGDTVQTIEWEPRSLEVTASDLDEYVAWRIQAFDDPSEQREFARELRSPGFASDRHATAVALRSDGVGRLWLVERFEWDRIQSPTWLVLGPSGRALGRWVEPLEPLDLLDADDTRALVRITDELGVHRVEVRRIVKGNGTSG